MAYQMTLDDLLTDNQKYVRRISYNDVKPFIMGIHYARRMPPVQYAFGLFLGGY